MPRIQVLVVDDHPVVRRGLRDMLADAENIEIIGEASSAEEALELASTLQPDILLLDIQLPGMDGLRLLRYVKTMLPSLKVIILSHYDNQQFLSEAFRAGAYGYLLKNISREKLIDALYTVYQGKRMLSQELVSSMLTQFAELAQKQAVNEFGLSDKEIKLLKLVAEGSTNQQIAEILFWSESTVKRKLSDIFQKLNVSDRAQAVAVAMRHGLI